MVSNEIVSQVDGQNGAQLLEAHPSVARVTSVSCSNFQLLGSIKKMTGINTMLSLIRYSCKMGHIVSQGLRQGLVKPFHKVMIYLRELNFLIFYLDSLRG